MTEYDAENDALQGALRRALRSRTASSACPPETSWLALLSKELTPDDAEMLRRHLGECSRCAAVAADARRFLRAMGGSESGVPHPRSWWWGIGSVAAAAAVVVLAWTAGLLREHGAELAPDATAELVAAIELPAPPAVGEESSPGKLVYRGGVDPESIRSLTAALAPYRGRQFAAACRALAEHGRSFPADREARFLAAVSCLKARELDQSEALLASLAAVAGDRRDDARALLDRLRTARRSRPR